MKRQIFLYLFLLTALVLLFFVVNMKKEMKDRDDKIVKIENRLATTVEKYQDTIGNLRIEVMEQSKFSLADDPYAIEYLYKEGHDFNELIPSIQDQLVALNVQEGGNPLVPYAAMAGDRMMINGVKMLNHKWAIADFTDGKYWGQILLKVSYNEDKTIGFETAESFLYPADVID